MKVEGAIEIEQMVDMVAIHLIKTVVFIAKVAATLWLAELFGVIDAIGLR